MYKKTFGKYGTIYLGDNRQILRLFKDNTFTSCLSDPPYEISFFFRNWDQSGISFDPKFWNLLASKLQYGATLCAFAGTRTQHRIAVAIEDSGFILKDILMWVQGMGMPKAMSISKSVDKYLGNEREVVSVEDNHNIKGGNLVINNTKNFRNKCFFDEYSSDEKNPLRIQYEHTKAKSVEGKLWEGYFSHSSLKPAYEPIIFAMKENKENYIQNALKLGLSGINIDAIRNLTEGEVTGWNGNTAGGKTWNDDNCGLRKEGNPTNETKGRFPTNLILQCNCVDPNAHSEDCPIKIIDDQTGIRKGGGRISKHVKERKAEVDFVQKEHLGFVGFQDTGGGSRFFSRIFYCSKANAEREEFNNHPTLKPLGIMLHLTRMVKQPNRNIIIDPFCGSGTTLLACLLTGQYFVGIEQDKKYFEIACKRMENYINNLEEYKKRYKC